MNEYQQNYNQNSIVPEQIEPVSKYVAKTYLWMFVGLMLTFLIAIALLETGLIIRILINNPAMWYIIVIAELVVVMILAAAINKLPVAAAYVLFFLYAVLNAFTFAMVFWMFDATSSILIFAATAVIFGIMGATGYFTERDLSGWRSILLFGLFALILMGILGLIFNLSGLEMIISLIGVAVFMGFTAYDTQRIKNHYYELQGDEAMLQKASIFSAFQLYLDFINLFLYMLRIFGRRR